MQDLGSWIQTYTLPTGRRIFAHRGVLKALDDMQLDAALKALKAHVESAVSKDKKTIDLEHQWLQAKNPPARPEAMKIDIELDRTVSGLVSFLRVSADAPVDTPAKAPAQKLLEELFPAGPLAVMHLAHEEEVSAIRGLLAKMKGTLEAEVAALPIAPYVARLDELTTALKEELERAPKDAVSFDVVRAAQENGHSMLLETVARVLGAFPGRGEDEKKRAALLAPIWRQNEDVRQARQRRRRPSDVNPDTGAPLDVLPVADLGADVLPA